MAHVSKCTSIPDTSFGNATITSQKDIANPPRTHFTYVFSLDTYDPSFKLLKDNTEALLLNFISWFTQSYILVWMNCLQHYIIVVTHRQELTISITKCCLTVICRHRICAGHVQLYLDRKLNASCLERGNSCPYDETR
jgi:hypothetical protein